VARVDLNVPFSEKDEAKALGARWDATTRNWYVPDGVDSAPFDRWIPRHRAGYSHNEDLPNVRASSFGLAMSRTRCWKCSTMTPVACLVVGPEHEEDCGDLDDCWERADYASALSDITFISVAALDVVRERAPWFRRVFSKTAEREYWGNTCTSCGALQGDFHLHQEPGAAFCPTTAKERARISIVPIVVPLEASASVGIDTDWVEF
jgi:hypothetical protein